MDINRALAAVEDVLARWWVMQSWPGVPPFSGGVLDAWPARMANGLAVCRTEWAAVQAMVQQEAQEKAAQEKAAQAKEVDRG